MTKTMTAALVAAFILAAGLVVAAQSRALVSGTKLVTTTASALSSGPCVEVVVQNDLLSGTGYLAVGSSTAQDVRLVVGASITIPIDDLSKVYVKAIGTTGTQVVNWLCRKN